MALLDGAALREAELRARRRRARRVRWDPRDLRDPRADHDAVDREWAGRGRALLPPNQSRRPPMVRIASMTRMISSDPRRVTAAATVPMSGGPTRPPA